MIQTLEGPKYNFGGPTGIAASGTHVVLNPNGSSLMELNASNGDVVRALHGPQDPVTSWTGIADDGTHLDDHQARPAAGPTPPPVREPARW